MAKLQAKITADIYRDPKVKRLRRVTLHAMEIYVTLHCLFFEGGLEGGLVAVGNNMPFEPGELAQIMDLPEADIVNFLVEADKMELIEYQDGFIRLKSVKKSMSSAERVRRYRAKKKAEDSVTGCNDSVTLHVTPNVTLQCNEDVTGCNVTDVTSTPDNLSTDNETSETSVALSPVPSPMNLSIAYQQDVNSLSTGGNQGADQKLESQMHYNNLYNNNNLHLNNLCYSSNIDLTNIYYISNIQRSIYNSCILESKHKLVREICNRLSNFLEEHVDTPEIICQNDEEDFDAFVASCQQKKPVKVYAGNFEDDQFAEDASEKAPDRARNDSLPGQSIFYQTPSEKPLKTHPTEYKQKLILPWQKKTDGIETEEEKSMRLKILASDCESDLRLCGRNREYCSYCPRLKASSRGDSGGPKSIAESMAEIPEFARYFKHAE